MNRLTCAETAKLVRAELKRQFPAITFSIRSSTYSMGASIRVRWTDGPTAKQVKHAVSQYEGADFDGMVDLKTYRGNGMGADFIFCEREYTVAKLTGVADRVARKYGFEPCDVMPTSWGAQLDGHDERIYQRQPGAYHDLRDLVHQALVEE